VPRLFSGVKEDGAEVEHLMSWFRMSGAIRPAPPPPHDFMVFTGTDLTFFNITFFGFHTGLSVGLIDIPLHQGKRQEFVVPLWTECAFDPVALYQFCLKFLLHSP
jgi:hypothetical protein